MSHVYTPTDVPLTTITLPDDGDPRTVASVNSPFQDSANAILSEKNSRIAGDAANAAAIAAIVADVTLRTHTWTVNGTWTCPADVSEVELFGCGGGGGGGSGAYTIGYFNSGGGGGGASIPTSVVVPVTPGQIYNVEIGAGGAAGAAVPFSPNLGLPGSPGADTIFRRVFLSTVMARFPGAGGGVGGIYTVGAALCVASGGTPNIPTLGGPGSLVGAMLWSLGGFGTVDRPMLITGTACGGYGTDQRDPTSGYLTTGGRNICGTTPNGGIGGSYSPTTGGSGGGGGGSGFPGGSAGAGGDGQNGVTAPTAGTPGVLGGGGGGGGSSDGTATTPAPASAGGSGGLILRWRGQNAVIT